MQPRADNPSAFGIRWWILLMLFLAMTINFLDRQVLSIVSPVLHDQLHFSDTDYSVVLFFFMFGMTMGQVPVGMLIDKYGARRGFSCLVIGWSIVGMLHSLGRTIAQFCGLRFLMGLHECGSFSAGVKVIGEWFPAKERALASGLFNSGTLVGSIVAPPLIVFITAHYGWRAAFLIPGAVGCLWVLPWLRLYWEPARHPRLTDSDRVEISRLTTHANPSGIQPRVRSLLGSGPVWGVILLRAFGGPVNQFYWYWLPLYLTQERGMSLKAIGLVAWMPFFCGGVGNIGGGWLSSALVRKGWEAVRARKAVVMLATLLCLLATLVPLAGSPASAITLICAAAFGINAMSANHMAVVSDVFPETILARVSGLTGVGDGVISMILMLCTGWVVDHFSFRPIFVAIGLMPVVALASLLLLVRSGPGTEGSRA